MSAGITSENWLFSEVLGMQVATYKMGSVSARVEDDGERATYEVQRGDEVIASGGDPDLDASIEAVEAELVDIGWLWRAPAQDERVAA